MRIREWRYLRTLRNEAERQAEFYTRRNDAEAAKVWADISDCASEAIEIKGELVLTVMHQVAPKVNTQREVLKDPPLIKVGEQGQQLPKSNKDNGFRRETV